MSDYTWASAATTAATAPRLARLRGVRACSGGCKQRPLRGYGKATAISRPPALAQLRRVAVARQRCAAHRVVTVTGARAAAATTAVHRSYGDESSTCQRSLLSGLSPRLLLQRHKVCTALRRLVLTYFTEHSACLFLLFFSYNMPMPFCLVLALLKFGQ